MTEALGVGHDQAMIVAGDSDDVSHPKAYRTGRPPIDMSGCREYDSPPSMPAASAITVTQRFQALGLIPKAYPSPLPRHLHNAGGRVDG